MQYAAHTQPAAAKPNQTDNDYEPCSRI